MDHPTSPTTTCCCSQKAQEKVAAPTPPIIEATPVQEAPAAATLAREAKKTYKTVPSILLSVGIAFFPKCPLCWAAYMSMFGSFGLSNLPYMKWLLPVLIGFLGLHLFLILKKVKEKGYGPFVVSLVGALVIIGGREFFPDSKPVLLTGMLFILSGSLWNSFSIKSFKGFSMMPTLEKS